jgi:hypothetical protein
MQTYAAPTACRGKRKPLPETRNVRLLSSKLSVWQAR